MPWKLRWLGMDSSFSGGLLDCLEVCVQWCSLEKQRSFY